MRNNAIRSSVVLTLIVAALGVMALIVAGEPSHARAIRSAVLSSAPSTVSTTGPTTGPTTVPFTVAPEFEAENGEVWNCVGSFAERPGCGATGRGGWRQTLVFLLIVAGLALIAARIIIGVRRNSSRT